MNTNKILSMTSGKYSDFKKEEYNIMQTRIAAINNILTEKCNAISLKPLGKHFSFNFEFHAIGSFLSKIDDFDKKQRKDPLKKWWMNQKASEMATTYLPAILDKLDEVALNISKQEKQELLQNKFKKYLIFELLECALECKFSRPRAAQSSVFPNTSFQYARSRLRKKLENIYFNETELTEMTPNKKKKKEEWAKMIKNKKTQCKQEYFRERNKKKAKNKHKRRQQLMKQETNNKMPYYSKKNSMSMSSSVTISESFQSSAAASSDMPILDTIHAIPPPPPPQQNNSQRHINLPPNVSVSKMQIFSTHSLTNNNNNNNNTYCANCTSLTIELSNLTKQFHQIKMNWGSTQQQLDAANDEIKRLKSEIKHKDIYKNINYKHKYEEAMTELQNIKSQVFAAVSNSSSGNRSNKTVKRRNENNNNPSLPNIPNIVNVINGTGSVSRTRIPSQDMSWKSSEFSVNAISDKMSISGGNDSMNQFNIYNMNSGVSVVDNSAMSEVYNRHLKHNSNSTDEMLKQLTRERKEDGLSVLNNEQFLCPEAESVLYPIHNNNNNIIGMDINKSRASVEKSHSVVSQTTTQSNGQSHSTFNSNINNGNGNVNMNYNISNINMNNNMNNKIGHYRNHEHINNINDNQMFVDNNMTMPKINNDINTTQTQVYVVNNNNMNDSMIITNGNEQWNRNSNNNIDNINMPQFSSRQNNNMNYNNNNNIQFPPSINDHQQFVYDNH